MDQLLNLPAIDHSTEAGAYDCRPRTLSECIVNRKLDIRRYIQFKKRSYEDLQMQVESLLFSTSLLQEGHHNGELEEARDNSSSFTIMPAKKKRKERQFVMFTDPHTGLRCRLYPTMSLWYVLLPLNM